MCLNTSASAGFKAPVPLNTKASADTGSDTQVALETDGLGIWVATWSSEDTLANTIGADSDILFQCGIRFGADARPIVVTGLSHGGRTTPRMND